MIDTEMFLDRQLKHSREKQEYLEFLTDLAEQENLANQIEDGEQLEFIIISKDYEMVLDSAVLYKDAFGVDVQHENFPVDQDTFVVFLE